MPTSIYARISMVSSLQSSPTPAGRSSLVHRQSSSMYHHTRLLKQKNKCVCLRIELKADQHKKIPWRWGVWQTDHCCQSFSASPPAPRWHHSPWYSSRRTSAICRVPMTLDWAARRSAPQAHQQGSTPGRCTTGCATPLHTSCSRTLTQRQKRPSSERIRIYGRSVATYMAGWASNGRWAGRRDGVVIGCGAQNNPRVADVGNDHEVPLLDDGQHCTDALDRVQAAAASEIDIHSGSCGHVELLPDVELAVVKLLLIVDEQHQRERLLLVVFVQGFQAKNMD
jgi:hypothetical protein